MVTAATSTLPQLRGTSSEQRTLVMAAAAHNPQAFGALYNRHARIVYNMILRSVRHRETAEDIAQEVWIKVYRDLPKLRDPLAFPAWLYQMTSKACVDAARKRTRAPHTAEIADDIPAARDDPEAAALDTHDVQLTREALALLPAHQHLALFLREVDDRSYREISQIVGISETAVGLCLLRARRSFAKTYERLDRASQQERCGQMQSSLARVFDGEATPVQRAAVDGHLAACARCREELRLMREGSKRYAALALAPVPAALNAKIAGALGLGAGGGLGGAAGLAGSLAAKLKMVLFGLLAAGGVAAGVTVVPGAAPAVEGGLSHVRDAPFINQLVGDTPSGGSGSSTGTVRSSPSAGGAIDTSNKSLVPQAGTAVPVQASLPDVGINAGLGSQLIGAVETPVSGLGGGVQLPTVAVPAQTLVVPTVVVLPPDVLPGVSLPPLSLAVPTVTVGDLTLP